MSPTRRLALKIAGWVVRFSSPGCKDWAEGLAHEIGSIESDRAALCWAAGSTRILFDRRDRPIVAIGDVPSLAEEYLASRKRELAQQLYVCAILAPILLWMCTDPLMRAYSLTRVSEDISTGMILTLAVRAAISLRNLPVQPADPREWITIYRRQLLRDIRFVAGWVNLLSVALIALGMIVAWLGVPGSLSFHAQQISLVLAFLLVPAIGLYIKVRKLRSRVHDVDQLFAEHDADTRL